MENKIFSIWRAFVSPQEETILKKYDQFPKMFGKVFKDQKPSIVQDSKGNSWFEFNIPKDMLSRELLYKSGGKSPKLIRRKEAKK